MIMHSLLLANTIAPLVFAAGVQLLIGNFLIGVVEAGVIRILFREKGRRLLWTAVAANYVSMFAAYLLLPAVLPLVAPAVLGDRPFHRLGTLVVAVVVVCFLVSLLVEWPVFYAGLRRSGAGRLWTAGASLRATLATLLISFSSHRWRA